MTLQPHAYDLYSTYPVCLSGTVIHHVITPLHGYLPCVCVRSLYLAVYHRSTSCSQPDTHRVLSLAYPVLPQSLSIRGLQDRVYILWKAAHGPGGNVM